MEIRERVKLLLQEMPRGTVTDVCLNTSVTKPEISNWLSERRPLSDTKILEIVGHLIEAGLISVEVRV